MASISGDYTNVLLFLRTSWVAMEASKLPMQHKYLQKYIPQPAFATILERLLAAEQYEDSQDE